MQVALRCDPARRDPSVAGNTRRCGHIPLKRSTEGRALRNVSRFVAESRARYVMIRQIVVAYVELLGL